MKIKGDFITNSSSTSFMLYIDTEYDSLEKFTENWNKYIQYFIEENRLEINQKVEERINEINEIREKIKNGELKIGEKFQILKYERQNPNLEKEKMEMEIIGHMVLDHCIGNVFTVEHISDCPAVKITPEFMKYIILLNKLYDSNIYTPDLKKDYGFKDVKLQIMSLEG